MNQVSKPSSTQQSSRAYSGPSVEVSEIPSLADMARDQWETQVLLERQLKASQVALAGIGTKPTLTHI